MLQKKQLSQQTLSYNKALTWERGKVATVKDEYGFIRRLGQASDIFYHISDVQGKQALQEGDSVEYRAVFDKASKQLRAKNVKLLGRLDLVSPRKAEGSSNDGSQSARQKGSEGARSHKGSEVMSRSKGNDNSSRPKGSDVSPRPKVTEITSPRPPISPTKSEPFDDKSLKLFMPAWMKPPLPMSKSEGSQEFEKKTPNGSRIEQQQPLSASREEANGPLSNRSAPVTPRKTPREKDKLLNLQLLNQPRERGVIRMIKEKFGFIACASAPKGQVFFHNNEVDGANFPKEGDEVEFWIVPDPRTGGKDLKATGVRVVGALDEMVDSGSLEATLSPSASKSAREWLKSLEDRPSVEGLLLNLDRFKDLVNQQLSLPMIESIIKLLISPEIRESERTDRAFQIALQSNFFRNPKNLQSYILKLYSAEDVISSFMSVVDLMEEMLDRFADSHKDLPLVALESTLQKVSKKCSPEILARMNEKMSKLLKLQDQMKGHSSASREIADNESDFRSISIFPTTEDMLLTWENDIKKFLKPNLPRGKFEGLLQYLDTHFRLLREDCLQPLREGIRAFKNQTESRDVRVYKNVRASGIRCAREGIVYRVTFEVDSSIVWERSKRLMYGNLLCLSSDGFKTLLWATVANRDVALLKSSCQIDIRFPSSLQTEMSPSSVYTMVESATTYFEAYQHVLRALQQLDINKFPFADYLVNCQNQVRSPAYLKSQDGNSADNFNFSNVFEGGRSSFPILQNPWPNVVTTMDESQLSAFKLSLTKELVLIQGPPGTGKTFVGLKIMRALLDNSHLRRKSPILVICYTNHALDQFLEGIYSFGQINLVRIGSRCKSEKLKERNLRKLMYEAFPQARKEHHQTRRMIIQQLERLEKEVAKAVENINCKYIDFETVQMVASAQHIESLQSGNLDWSSDLLRHWLEEAPSKVVALDKKKDEKQEKHKEKQEKGKRREKADNDEDEEEEELDDEAVLQLQLERMVGEDDANQESSNGLIEIHQLPEFPPDMLPSKEVLEVQDVWTLSVEDRKKLYRHWVTLFRQKEGSEPLRTIGEKYEKFSRDKLSLEEDIQRQILEKADVIGMTTTGVAKFHKLIQSIQPEIVLVEEAAEVLEAHIIAALGPSTKHLILIGDHQQLRPSTAVYQLAAKYHLDVSLFERLINNGMEQVTLSKQRRMRPDISKLLRFLYPQLGDSPHVFTYPHVRGVGSDVYFLNHNEEEFKDPENCSRSNKHEASMLARLASYLVMQGYDSHSITVLTPYFGQVRMLRQEFRQDQLLENIRITSVDNYQGEECEIILLSLVRSNSTAEIGFLRINNRVCVALSRAKVGFYIIGNGTLLRKQTSLWENVINQLDAANCFGSKLRLRCQNHPEDEIQVQNAADFKQAEDGGCYRQCNQQLTCGHHCPRKCHPFSHDLISCYKPCQKTCERGHPCNRRCYEDCGHCTTLVEKQLPCGHKDMIMCFVQEDEHMCSKPCERKLPCGHICGKICGKACKTYCHTLVERDLKCGHTVMLPCSELPSDNKCKQPHIV